MNNFHDKFLNLKLEQLYEYGDVIFFIWENKEGWPLRFVSPNCQHVLGYSQQEFANASITYSSLIHQDDLERVTAEVVEHSNSTEPAFTHQDYRIKHKNGLYIWVKDTTIVERDEQGNVLYYMGHIHDVTANHELLHQSQLATIGELSSGLAHELKNPLSTISLAAEILLQNNTTATDKELKKLELIKQSANRIQKTIQGMLKLAAKHDVIEREVHCLQDLMNETLQLFTDKLHKYNITLSIDIDCTHSVYCDELTFTQTLINLLQNAIDAIQDHADPTISISSQVEENNTKIFITDSGTTFDYSMKEEIFEPFFTTKEQTHGTGIGLHLCKYFIQLNKGSIQLVSTENTPTTFQITLPSLP